MKIAFIRMMIFCGVIMLAGQHALASDELSFSPEDEQKIKKMVSLPDPAAKWNLKEYANMDMNSQFQALIYLYREEYKAKRDLFLTQDGEKLIAFLKSKLQDKASSSREHFLANILLERIEKKDEINHFFDLRETTEEEKKAYVKRPGFVPRLTSVPTKIDDKTFFQEKTASSLVYFFLEKFWKTPDAYEVTDYRGKHYRRCDFYEQKINGDDRLFAAYMFQKTALPNKIEELRICADDLFLSDEETYARKDFGINESVLWELACYYNWRECFPKLFELVKKYGDHAHTIGCFFLEFRATKDDIPCLESIVKENQIFYGSRAEDIITALQNDRTHEDFILRNGSMWNRLYGKASFVTKFLPVLPEMKESVELYREEFRVWELRQMEKTEKLKNNHSCHREETE